MIARGVRKVDESRDRRGIQSGRILKYWTEVICWYVFRDMVLASLIRVETMSKNGENADTISRLDLRVPRLPRSKLSEMDLLIEERVKFEHVCAISLSKNLGLRLLLLLDGVLPSFKHHLRHLARRSRAIAGPSLFQQFHQFIVDLYNK